MFINPLYNMKVIKCFLALLLSSVIFGCSNDNNVIAPLCFEKEYFEKPLLKNSQEIAFSGGSSDLSIEVSDTDILDAAISSGKIEITTKSKGTVYLVVKDKIENTSVTLRVKVVDSYLSMRLGSPIPTNSAYEKGDCLFLVNNTSRAFYLYDEFYNLKGTGSYQLYLDNSKFFLSLSFPENTRVYDISGSSDTFLFGAIPTILDFSWSITTNSRSASPISMNAVDSYIGYTYYFYVDSAEIPYGILN
jgi:hypothetical protein